MSEAGVPKKRNRNRLKEFYGIKKEDNVDKTTDINSDQFHSDVYMKVRTFMSYHLWPFSCIQVVLINFKKSYY